MYQFILSRVDENIRLAISSFAANNRLGFYFSLRSQIEINSHVFYLSKDEKYAQQFLQLSENRTKIKTNSNIVKNITTLVEKFEKENSEYKGFYDRASKIVHPNPSNIFRYSRLRHKDQNLLADTDRMFEAQWFDSEDVKKVAHEWLDLFIDYCNHSIILFDSLDYKTEVDSDEQKKELNIMGLFEALL